MQVESRENAKGNFGLGYKRTMTFSNFLKRLEEGDTSLYLTTQEVCPSTVHGRQCCLISLPKTCIITASAAAENREC